MPKLQLSLDLEGENYSLQWPRRAENREQEMWGREGFLSHRKRQRERGACFDQGLSLTKF